MAQLLKLKPHILRWEGGYSNHPFDRGGPTNMGVTLRAFRSVFGEDKTIADLKAMTDEQWMQIFKAYWNPCHGDEIQNQSLANLIVDMAFNSGSRNAIRRVQTAIGVISDGIVGKVTLGVLNTHPKECFVRIWNMRKAYYESIVANDPSQKVFLCGWLNRLNSLKWHE